MEKGIILYQSKYGAAEKYAHWLRDMTGFSCLPARGADVDTVSGRGTVILCGGIYASGIAGLSFLKKNAARLSGARLAVLGVGASPADAQALEALRARNLKNGLEGAALFYARGAWDEEKMTLRDRTLCRLLQKAVARQSPDALEPWMRALLGAAGQACDWTDKAYLQPLIAWLGEQERGDNVHPIR